jgi:3-mercaptopyruvate sulfurtransferase SseA
VALKLRRFGITRVRPLSGGYAEWKRLGFPLEDAAEGIDWQSTAASV